MKKLEAQMETFDSTIDTESDLDPTGHKEKTTLGLDKFLSTYESEDDASFKEMLARSSEVQHQKHAWLHAKEQEYAKITPEEKIYIAENTSELQRRAGLDSWTYTAKNTLMYIPDGVEESAVETVQGASRKREIIHSSTRLPHLFVQKFQCTECTKRPTQDKVGVDGNTSNEKSPKVNGYGFLATPMINPGE